MQRLLCLLRKRPTRAAVICWRDNKGRFLAPGAGLAAWAPGCCAGMSGGVAAQRMGVIGVELRQLRYFVTLAEELHFGRAAAREHIVQSALSQQLQRLERELGVPLLERTTHHVRLTAAGTAFLLEARQILAHVDRAAAAARRAARSAPALRVGTVDASYDSMPTILRQVQARFPDLEIHQVEAGVPEQYMLLTGGQLDIGIGRASLAPPEVASELFRLDPLGYWSARVTASPHRRAFRLRRWPRSRCYSRRSSGLLSSISS